MDPNFGLKRRRPKKHEQSFSADAELKIFSRHSPQSMYVPDPKGVGNRRRREVTLEGWNRLLGNAADTCTTRRSRRSSTPGKSIQGTSFPRTHRKCHPSNLLRGGRAPLTLSMNWTTSVDFELAQTPTPSHARALDTSTHSGR